MLDPVVSSVQSRLKEIDDRLESDKKAYAEAEALLAERAKLLARRTTHTSILEDLRSTCDHDWEYGLWDRMGQDSRCKKCGKTEFIRRV